MNGRKKTGALALGTLAVVPLASAEPAHALLTADGGGPAATEPSPPAANAPAPTPPTPAPARSIRAVEHEAEQKAEPPASGRSIRVAERQAERNSTPPANGPPRQRTIERRPPGVPATADAAERHFRVEQGLPPAPKPPAAGGRERTSPGGRGDGRRKPTIDVEAPPTGVRSRPPGVPATADAAERHFRVEQGLPPAPEPPAAGGRERTSPGGRADGRRKPTTDVETPRIGVQARPPGVPAGADAAERHFRERQGLPSAYEQPAEPEESDDRDVPVTLPGPGDRPGESTAGSIAEDEAPSDDEEAQAPDEDGGGFSFGVNLPDVSLPDVSLPDVSLPDVSLPDIDREWLTNPRGKLAEEQEDVGEATAEKIRTTAEATKAWMDQRPMCAGGTVYRYGGGGGEVCIDTRTGETAWKGQLGVGAGGTFKVHRPESLPQNVYCGGGATISSPVVYGTYERRYDFTENRWYNAYEYGLSVPYKNTKYLPVDGGSWRPSKGRHVAGRGDRRPPSGAAPRHRATPSPGKIATSYVKPGSAAAYGVCGGPGPDLY